jgi:hypothetical protein
MLSQGSQKQLIFLQNQPFLTTASKVKLTHYVLHARCLMPLMQQTSRISILTKEAVQSYSKVKPYKYILLGIKINCYWIFGSNNCSNLFARFDLLSVPACLAMQQKLPYN